MFDVLKTLECDKYNSSYIRNLSVSLTNAQMNVDFNLIRPLVPEVRANMDFYNRKEISKAYQKFYKYSFDACSIMRNLRSSLFKRWFSTLFTHGNFRPDCPVPPNHYYVKNYNIKDLHIPSFLIPGFYRFAFNIFQLKNEGKHNDFLISCSIEIKMK
ncbi:hypothetical protein KR215_010566 [Drosophila sulfurigaster]|nr:hypothetical protein KR215_010566 [Drosophila sulfurigaster]